jgi:apolipoprotein N-acyltransferase
VISAQAAAASGARTGRAGDSGGFRTRWALLISVAGGLALYASFPPAGIWPLAVLGPALLVLALTGRSLRGSFGCALVFGLAQFVPLLSWLINLAWYAWAALAVSEAVIFALLAIGQRLLLRLPYWPVAVAGWWVLVEGVRDRWPYAFPWGRLAMSQSVAPDVRWVAFGGAPLLSFLIALTGAMLAAAILAWLGPEGRARWTASAAAVVTAGLVLAGGLLPADPTGGAPTAQVAAIQGNVPRARNLPQQLRATQVTQNHVDATLKLAAQVKAGQRPAPDLVIWPENATDLDPFQNPSVYAQLSTAVAAIGKPILVGEVLNNPRRNVGQLWVPGRGPTTAYVKRQLVPFGEPAGGVRRREDQARRRDLLRGGLRPPGPVGGHRGRQPARGAVQRRRLRDRRPARRDPAADGDGQDPGGGVGPRRGVRLDHRGEHDHRAGRQPDRAQRRVAAGHPRRAGTAGEPPHAGGPGRRVAGVRDHHAHRAGAGLGGHTGNPTAASGV